MHNYERLDVWARSYRFALAVYEGTVSWPGDERFGLSSQVRRASVSIAANIAEGSSESSPRGFARYLRIAFGSACEVETHLRLASDLGYSEKHRHEHLCSEIDGIKRMLVSLLRRLDKESRSPGS
jgi:four helix bundle protein